MLLQFPLFYKNYGVRRPQQMLSPLVFTMDMLHFPRNALYHFITHDPDVVDPDSNNVYLSAYRKRIMIDFVTVLSEPEGNPRKKIAAIMQLVKGFLSKHKEFKYVRDPYIKGADPYTLMIINHAYISKLYKYNPTPMAAYYSWRNSEVTMWDKVIEIAAVSDREQFLFYNAPDVLPSIPTLKLYTMKLNKSILKVLDSPGKLFILEVWKWLDAKYRHTSILSKVPQEALSKINLVFMHNGKWIVINLNYLDQWREDPDKEKVPNVPTYKPILLQKFFLKMVMQLVSNSQPLAEDVADIEKEATDTPASVPGNNAVNEIDKTAAKAGVNPDEADPEEVEVGKAMQTEPLAIKPKPFSLKKHDASDRELEDILNTSIIESTLASLDKELEALDYIEKQNLKSKKIHVNEEGEESEAPAPVVEEKSAAQLLHEINTAPPANERLKQHLEEYAGYGLMSAADYRNATKAIEKYNELPNPYNPKEQMKNVTAVSHEDIQVNREKAVLANDMAIPDKSMLHSTLKTFDSSYVNNVHKKDVLAMVGHVQNAGVIIEDHTVEEDHSALGSFEYHTLKLKPLDGKSSIVRFKLPIVKPDSTFMANGTKYIMRKQRSDLPIRKIAPNIVALSSYYGKTFVQRSEYTAHNPAQWIFKMLDKSYNTDDNTAITNIGPADVYDNYFKAPYIYNAMAHHLKTVSTKEVELVFDHRWRETFIPKDKLKTIEADGSVVCGKYLKTGEPIIVKPNNEFYLYKDGILTELGNIYTLLHLPEEKSPVDFASVRIFSKTIPIGLILGYLLGFTKLLKLSGSQYKVLEHVRGYSKSVMPDEWSFAFSDKVYVFKRSDVKAMLIFGGFANYGKTIAEYASPLFDEQAVYMNLLESIGLSSIYLREIDNSNDLFVDPITKEILEEMKMPVTFTGLLIKATEMLEEYNNPDFQDMNFMRIKGYERMAGAVYKELSHSIRALRSRSIRGRSQIELNPYAVWKNITQDQSVKIIEETNPIQNLKEVEAVTYVGEGGRSKDTLVKHTRAYHETDIGISSEATSESADTGINYYLSANPNIINLRGMVKSVKDPNPTTRLSTSALLAPGSDHDD